jgi:hypothetical protein
MCLDAGLTIYEAGGGGPLPKNGEEWHTIRQGTLQEFQQCSQAFNKLIKVSQEAFAGYGLRFGEGCCYFGMVCKVIYNGGKVQQQQFRL